MPEPEESPDDTNPMVFMAVLFVPLIVIAGLWVTFAFLMWGFQ